MKIFKLCLLGVVALTTASAGKADAGIIPYSLIQTGDQPAKTATCENLERRQSEALKRIAALQREEKKNLAELETLAKSFCNETQS